MKNTLLFIIILASIGLNSCDLLVNCLDGNHDYVSENRNISSFTGIQSEGSLEIEVIQSDESKVIVLAESNLQRYIKTSTKGNNLFIDTKNRCLNNHEPIKVIVTTPNIERIELDGSGYIYSESINTEEINVYLSGSGEIELNISSTQLNAFISGSGEINLTGNTDKSDFGISGSGSINAFNLLQKDCEVHISGSGKAYISVEDFLDVRISGSGSVHYMGNPSISQNISGSGRIIKI